jgi:hypothetical protein
MILPNNWNENGKIIEIALAFFVVLIVGSFPVSTFDVVR